MKNVILDRINPKGQTGLIWVDGYMNYGGTYVWAHTLAEDRRSRLLKDYLPGADLRKRAKCPELALYTYFSEEVPKAEKDLLGVTIEPMFIDPKNATKARTGAEQIGRELDRRSNRVAEGHNYKAVVMAYKAGGVPMDSLANQTKLRAKMYSAVNHQFRPVDRYENRELFKWQVEELLRVLDQGAGEDFDPEAQIALLYEMGFRGGLETIAGKYLSLRELSLPAQNSSSENPSR